MSREENNAVIRRMLDEVIVGGNFDLMDELVAPDFVNHNEVGTGEASSSVGIEAFRQELKAQREAFPDLKILSYTCWQTATRLSPICGARAPIWGHCLTMTLIPTY